MDDVQTCVMTRIHEAECFGALLRELNKPETSILVLALLPLWHKMFTRALYLCRLASIELPLERLHAIIHHLSTQEHYALASVWEHYLLAEWYDD